MIPQELIEILQQLNELSGAGLDIAMMQAEGGAPEGGGAPVKPPAGEEPPVEPPAGEEPPA